MIRTQTSRRTKFRSTRRRGTAIIFVLGMLAIALSVCYAMMRTQVVSYQVHSNSQRRGDAQQAARAGISHGLRRMHTNSWAGVGTTLNGQLSGTETYDVSFAIGDPSLISGDPDYDKYPYRVTLTSTGYAEDPSDPSIVSTHTIQVVVELVPRKLVDEPTDWSTFNSYTVWQGDVYDFSVELQTRIEGPVRIQGQLNLADQAPTAAAARDEYLGDLEEVFTTSGFDERTFDGPVHLDQASNVDGDARLALLGVTRTDEPTSQPFSTDWIQPTGLSTYEIFPGGPTYNVEIVGPTLMSNLEPDPETNPLGVFYCSTDLEIPTYTTVEGTIVCDGNVTISGSYVQLEPVDLPALAGTTTPVQLPAVICNDLIIEASGDADITGFVAAFGKVDVQGGMYDDATIFNGRVVVAEELLIDPSDESLFVDWTTAYNDWLAITPVTQLFAEYMETAEMIDPTPFVTIKPDSNSVTYHWKEPADPVYEADPSDAGLFWDLIDWQENP